MGKDDIAKRIQKTAEENGWKFRTHGARDGATIMLDGMAIAITYEHPETHVAELSLRTFIENQPTAQLPPQQLAALWCAEVSSGDGSDEWHINALSFNTSLNEHGKGQVFIRYGLGSREDALTILKDAEAIKDIHAFLIRFVEGVGRVDKNLSG